MNGLRLLARWPSEESLDALPACHRHALEHGFGGEREAGVTRFVIRLTRSRRPYADSMEDPHGVAMPRENGRPVDDPDEVPPTEDLWRVFRSWVEARWRSAGETTPVADLEALREVKAILDRRE